MANRRKNRETLRVEPSGPVSGRYYGNGQDKPLRPLDGAVVEQVSPHRAVHPEIQEAQDVYCDEHSPHESKPSEDS